MNDDFCVLEVKKVKEIIQHLLHRYRGKLSVIPNSENESRICITIKSLYAEQIRAFSKELYFSTKNTNWKINCRNITKDHNHYKMEICIQDIATI